MNKLLEQDELDRIVDIETETGRCYFCHRALLDCICEDDVDKYLWEIDRDSSFWNNIS